MITPQWSNNYSGHDIQNPKTFNPSKQWMDALLKDIPSTSSNNSNASNNSNKYKSRSKAISRNRKTQQQQQQQSQQNGNDGTLTVNNHTFTGIWAKTLPKQPTFPDFDDDDLYIGSNQEKKYDENDDDDDQDEDQNQNENNNTNKKPPMKDRKKTVTIHSLFERKQSQQVNNIYAYSVARKYSVKEMDSINNSNIDD